MRFPDIFTGRVQHAGWSVIQAATLIDAARTRHCGSLLIYSALELRLAIEQLMFTVILVARGKADPATLRACNRKDGLLRVLAEVAPRYALKCKFSAVLVSFHPEIPQGAEWDLPALQRYHAALSELCHPQRALRGMGAVPEQWDMRLGLLDEIHAFLAAGMKKETAVLSFKGATPQTLRLWHKYAAGRISLPDLRKQFARVKPLIVNQQAQSRPYPARERFAATVVRAQPQVR